MSKEKWVAIEDTINLIGDHIEIRNCSAEYVCKKLNEQNQKINELEHRLSNCIEPKFKIGQEVWGIDIVRKDNIDRFIVREICYCADYGLYYKTDIGVNIYEYYFKLFATEEEAKAKLEEMKK